MRVEFISVIINRWLFGLSEVYIAYWFQRLNKAESKYKTHVPQGMPPLDLTGRATSYFEFWPLWLMYLPVFFQWILLSIRHRSLTLPLIANPAVPLSGMVGVAKSFVFEVAGDFARRWVLPWVVYEVSDKCVDIQAEQIVKLLSERSLSLPIVGKPNIGCRGVGVKLLQNKEELLEYLKWFPLGGSIQFQQLSRWNAEAGVFYVRHPGSIKGEITSVTLKYTPYVVGDGESTLGELVGADPRAKNLQHLYTARHAERWKKVIPRNEPYQLIFAASHSRGAIFRDAGEIFHDEGFLQTLDKIFEDIPGFFYGRLDIKFNNIQSLSQGKDFEIIEINGASSESINIWDRNTKFGTAIKTLLQQYDTLFKIGEKNRERGHKPPTLIALYKAWRYETDLVKKYPLND